MSSRRSTGEVIFDLLNICILILFCLVVVLPIVHVVAGAFSSSHAMTQGKVAFWPQEFTFENFANVTKNKAFWTSLYNSIFIVTVGTLMSLFLTVMTGYPLSKHYLSGRRLVIIMIVFTMIFQAPLIPIYLLVKSLGLLNTVWSLIIPAAISGFNLILCMTFLRTIPEELYEAARIDGMSEFNMLWRIAIPLSKPILVTLLLFYAVGYWNNYFNALLYITKADAQPMQVFLYKIIAQSDMQSIGGESFNERITINPASVQMATVVLATLPIVVLYPFMQKHFIKGAMLGSVKE